MGGSHLRQLGHGITGVLISSGLFYWTVLNTFICWGKLTQTYDSTRTCATVENIMKLGPQLIRRHLKTL